MAAIGLGTRGVLGAVDGLAYRAANGGVVNAEKRIKTSENIVEMPNSPLLYRLFCPAMG